MNQKQLEQLLAAEMMGMGSTAGPADSEAPQESFKSFGASQLYCAKCKKAMPVREKLLLTLPNGDLYDYLCTGCGSSLGTKTA